MSPADIFFSFSFAAKAPSSSTPLHSKAEAVAAAADDDGGSLHPLLGGLVDERLVDVGDDTAAGDGGLDEGVELLVAADGELQVARRDTLHLEVLARVTRQLQHLGRQVLEDRRRVHRGGGTDALVGVHPRLEESVDTPHGELQAGLRRPRLRRLL